MRHGSHIDPQNRFERFHRVAGDELWEVADELAEELRGQQLQRKIEYIDDESQSIVSENNSPDIPFRYSLNPYRGCIHGCAYCYARPYHEFLGFSAGLDFETKIVVKRNAPALFREFLSCSSWKPELINFSGITDCYQPAERNFRLTRGCVEVAAACKLPIAIITKNALVVRDLDLLRSMAEQNLVHLAISITTLNKDLAASMEPRTSTPAARLRTIELLSEAGLPVQVMVAPIIPGLNDSEIPALLEAAKQAGARAAGYTVLRLPLSVLPVFTEWLHRTQPLKADAVLSKIRSTRNGELTNSEFGKRMVGQGVFAETIRNTFKVFRRKFGFDPRLPPADLSKFVPPTPASGQMRLF